MLEPVRPSHLARRSRNNKRTSTSCTISYYQAQSRSVAPCGRTNAKEVLDDSRRFGRQPTRGEAERGLERVKLRPTTAHDRPDHALAASRLNARVVLGVDNQRGGFQRALVARGGAPNFNRTRANRIAESLCSCAGSPDKLVGRQPPESEAGAVPLPTHYDNLAVVRKIYRNRCGNIVVLIAFIDYARSVRHRLEDSVST